MGRHNKEIPADAPGRSLAEFMRQLRSEAGLTWREIAERCYVSHTMLSQNADGRLTPTWAPVRAWFKEFYRAVNAHEDIELSMSEEAATQQAYELWKACRAHQRKLERLKVISAPPASPAPAPQIVPTQLERLGEVLLWNAEAGSWQHATPTRGPWQVVVELDLGPRPADGSADATAAHHNGHGVAQRRRRPPVVARPTIQMPGKVLPQEDVKRVTPDSLYRVTSVSDVVASLNDTLLGAGFDISQLFRRARRGGDEPAVRQLLTEQVREALTGRYPPTPGIIRRVIIACGGTPRDLVEWDTITTPLLERLPARGRAVVSLPAARRPRPRPLR